MKSGKVSIKCIILIIVCIIRYPMYPRAAVFVVGMYFFSLQKNKSLPHDTKNRRYCNFINGHFYEYEFGRKRIANLPKNSTSKYSKFVGFI